MRISVIGAGVIGLSAAVRLREAGHDAHILARDLPADTTSAVAAAVWYPYRALPYDRVTGWSAATFRVLSDLAQRDRAAGVTVRWGTELLRVASPDPWWRSAVPEFERVRPADLPPGYADGWRFPAPVAETPRYLRWLTERFAGSGGTIVRRTLTTLDEAFETANVLVNASGLGARELVPDPSVTPVRGQVVYLAQRGVADWLVDEQDPAGPTYVVPRRDDVVCGGTAEPGLFDTTPDPGTAEAILARCRRLVPALRDAPVLGHRVGLRPVRPTVRLEIEPRAAGPVIHCYGHGGAGITLSWGCAEEVLRLVDTVR